MEFDDVADDIERVVVTPEEIDRRLVEMARELEKDLDGQVPLLIGVLTGAVTMMADLARHLRIPVTMDWMALSSYGSNAHSSGQVVVMKDLTENVSGRHVVIVEDIIDSGYTLSWLLGHLHNRGAASIRILTLLRKPDAMVVDVPVDYVGFDIANDFVVGYGLDYAGRYRNLRGVGVLKPSVYGGEG
jgi:hypoxanthine phosphoribosyltransferase